MKGKLSLTIIIGFTAFIFTMVMFTQFKTIEQTDITAIETMRETELREEFKKIEITPTWTNLTMKIEGAKFKVEY